MFNISKFCFSNFTVHTHALSLENIFSLRTTPFLCGSCPFSVNEVGRLDSGIIILSDSRLVGPQRQHLCKIQFLQLQVHIDLFLLNTGTPCKLKIIN